jgi:hypothetical protein
MSDASPALSPPDSAGEPSAGVSITAPWANIPSGAVARPEPAPQDRRFASLSSLPDAGRLRPKRDLSPVRQARAQERARAAAPTPPPAPAALSHPRPTAMPVGPVLRPVVLPAPAARQLGFNCPSCFSVLIIKDPASYDGKPAPCPTCGSRILPPRCVPDSPFSIVQRHQSPAPARSSLLPQACGYRQ